MNFICYFNLEKCLFPKWEFGTGKETLKYKDQVHIYYLLPPPSTRENNVDFYQFVLQIFEIDSLY